MTPIDGTSFGERLRAAADARIAPRPSPTRADMVSRAAALRRTRRCRAGAAATSILAATAVVVALGVLAITHGHDAARPATTYGEAPDLDALVAAGVDCGQVLTLVQAPATDGDVDAFDADCRPVPLLTGPADDVDAALSPDGTLVAVVRRLPDDTGTALLLLDRSTGELRRLDSTPGTIDDPSFSPDGHALAYARDTGDGDERLAIVSVDDTPAPPLPRFPADQPIQVSPVWSPDGDRIAYDVAGNGADGAVGVVDLTTGSVRRLPDAPRGALPTAWMDERLYGIGLLATTGDQVVVLDSVTGAVRATSPRLGRPPLAVSAGASGIHAVVPLVDAGSGVTSTVSSLELDLSVRASVTLPGRVVLVEGPTPPAVRGTTPDGRTYGSDVGSPGGTHPDLVAVALPGEVVGYAARQDLDGDLPRTPAEAQRQQDLLHGYDVAAYGTDGRTIVGLFSVGAGLSGNGVVVRVVVPPGGTTSILHGTVGLDHGCSFLDDAAGRHLLIWPYGVHVAADGTSLEDLDGRVVAPTAGEVDLHGTVIARQRASGQCAGTAVPLYVD